MRVQLDNGDTLDGVKIDRQDDVEIVISTGRQWWTIFATREAAGEAAREYWRDMAENDPREFTCMVGEETLIRWALEQSAGPGSTHVRSLQEWLDLWLDTPEEHFASYDGNEYEVEAATLDFLQEVGWVSDHEGEDELREHFGEEFDAGETLIPLSHFGSDFAKGAPVAYRQG